MDAQPMPGGNRCGRTAARSAGRSSCREGCAQAERRLVAGRAEREFVHVALADDHRAGLTEPRDDRRILASDVPRRTRDAAVVGDPLTSIRSFIEIVCPCRGPRERPLPQFVIELLRLRHRLGVEYGDEGIERGFSAAMRSRVGDVRAFEQFRSCVARLYVAGVAM